MCSTSLSSADYATVLVPLLESLKQEAVLNATENGPFVCEVINYAVKYIDTDQARDFFSPVASQLEACLQAGGRCKLPSSRAERMWSAFHQFRTKPELKEAWSTFIDNIRMPVSLHSHIVLALQILVDRWFKKMITMKRPAETQRMRRGSLSPLSLREQNIVFYMSGYVSVKLIKKYRKRSSSKVTEQKHRLFVTILKRMRANDQADYVESVNDYTRVWSEQIDRGGLYQINPQVYVHARLMPA